MSASDCQGCREYLELSRRQFLGVSGATAIAAATPAWLPRVALAQDACTDRDVVIAVFLRGAADALTMCVPHGDPHYYAARPTLSVPQPDSGSPFAATDLDGFFGLPPSLTALLPAYSNGDLLIVHACGSIDTSRSHFDAMTLMELANPANPGQFTGWLGRHLATTAPLVPGAVLRGVALGGRMPRSFGGAPASLPVPKPAIFTLSGGMSTNAARRAVITQMHDATTDPLRTAAQTTQATIDLLATIDFVNYLPAGGAVYPDSPFGQSMRAAAALIKSDIGVEAIGADIGGWDHHVRMGPLEGILASKLTDLAATLAALHADLSAANGRNFVVVVHSEFGRRVEENGGKGCDHGHGGAMMVLGNHVNGGQVIADWPGLAPEQLFESRDLERTIDYRDILAEIVQNRLANPDLAAVFPNFIPTFRGVTEVCAAAGDVNCDGQVNAEDASAFSLAAMDETSFRAANPGCDPVRADLNGDGLVDGRDVQELTRRILGQ